MVGIIEKYFDETLLTYCDWCNTPIRVGESWIHKSRNENYATFCRSCARKDIDLYLKRKV